MIHSYPAFDLWRTSSTQSGFFHSRHEQSLCFVVLRKGVLKHHTQALEMAASAFPITAGRGETPSFMEASAVPIMWVQTYTMHTHVRACTHTHTPIQHNPATARLSPAWKATMTNRCCRGSFFFLFFPSSSSHWAFFPQPWHKMVKWCSTAEFNFTVQLGPWLHCQIQINVHLTNMDQRNSGWQPAVIRAIDSCVEFYVLSTPAHHWWNWLIKWIHCYNYL